MRSAFVLLLLLGAQLTAHTQTGASAPGFSVMLWTLNKVGAYPARVEVVASAGYHHLELVDEYQHWDEPAWQKALAQLHTLGITVDAIAGVQAGFADPAQRAPFLAQLQDAIRAAHRLGSPEIILLSGPVLPALSPAQQHAAAIANLRAAAPLLAAAGLTAVIEPIDRLENSSIYLDSVEEAFAITEAVASQHIKVLYDLYHQQRGHGNLIENLKGHLTEVGLIHVAEVPGRGAPGTGEIDYPAVYRALARLGFHGIIAMEFFPSKATPTGAADELRAAREDAEQLLSPAAGQANP
jgi:hydroxypyruvate isomerase